MVPKPSGFDEANMLSFRAVLFRMVPKLINNIYGGILTIMNMDRTNVIISTFIAIVVKICKHTKLLI